MNLADIINGWVIPVIAILAAVWGILRPWIRDNRIKAYADEVVAAAEQIFGIDGDGNEKLYYALPLLRSKFNLGDDDARLIIESAVYLLNQSQKLCGGAESGDNG